MKCLKYLLLLIVSFFSVRTFAQENPDEMYEDENSYINYSDLGPFRSPLDTARFQMGLYVATMPFINQQSFGGGIDFQAGYTNNLSIGISFAMTGRKVDPKFGYNIGESKMLYYDISLFNEFKFLQWRRLAGIFRLYTGFSAFHLSDNSIKEKYWWYDEYGNGYEGERALPIANNYFMRLGPALSLQYKISYNVAIEACTVYNIYIGNPKYGQRADFNNYLLQLGIKCNFN